MKRIGIVGGGQLARMLAWSGIPRGYRFVFLDPADDACAAPLGLHVKGNYDDRRSLLRFAIQADAATYEFENVPEDGIAYLSRHVPVYPNAAALAAARDRLNEKSLFKQLGIPVAPYAEVNSLCDLEQAVAEIGYPALLKTRTLGYDGKGQQLLLGSWDLEPAWNALGKVPLLLEGLVRYDRELSCIAVRGKDGATVFYPPSENYHRGGILRISWSRPGDEMEERMQAYVQRVLDRLDYVGVLTIEFFQAGDALLANEMAPRVHNSGHWTIEGAETSQFENHLRAILGLPLGATSAAGFSAMINCIGHVPDPAAVMHIPGARLHHYGKDFRPGRKVGHITIRSDSQTELRARVRDALQLMEQDADCDAGPDIQPPMAACV